MEIKDGRISLEEEVLLQVLLPVLAEGVIICDPEARIILCNQTAAKLFGDDRKPSPGDSLFCYCEQAPVQRALRFLKFQQQGLKSPQGYPLFIQFVNTAPARDRFFRCRLSMLPPGTKKEESFIIIFEDISSWYNPHNPFVDKIEEFRAPLTNLRAAVENLTEYPEMSPVMRTAFENVLVQESLILTEAFDVLTRACDVLLQTRSHLAEMSTELLFGYVKHSLQRAGITVSTAGTRRTQVKVDAFGLVLVLKYLGRKILRDKGLDSITYNCNISEKFVYFDFIWPGEFLPTAVVESLLKKRLKTSVGGLTVASIFHAMEGDMWSQQFKKGKGVLRVALPLREKA